MIFLMTHSIHSRKRVHMIYLQRKLWLHLSFFGVCNRLLISRGQRRYLFSASEMQSSTWHNLLSSVTKYLLNFKPKMINHLVQCFSTSSNPFLYHVLFEFPMAFHPVLFSMICITKTIAISNISPNYTYLLLP